jgi:inhibitor of KinA
MIAGGQCLITTLPMPTGWWVIGATRTPVLRPDNPEPFLFRPGDRVRFIRQERTAFDAA